MLLPAPEGEAKAPRWIHVMPSGTFHGRDGRGPYSVTDAAAVVRASLKAASARGIPMDYDHQFEHTSKNGMPAPASGWIAGLEAREDGIWAEVEWTERAAEHVAAKEYRYVSPVFYYGADGKISSIESVALTNTPNFRLRALAAKEAETLEVEEKKSMHKALASMLGLNAEASEDAVESAVRALREENKALAAKAENPDPEKYVPAETLEEARKSLAAMQEAQAQTLAEAMVGAAQAEGKLIPAMCNWAKGYASENPEGFKTFASLMPDLRPGGETGKAGAVKDAPPSGAGALTDEEKAMAAICGMTEDEYKKGKGV